MGTFIFKRKIFGAVEDGLKNMSEWLRDIKKIKPGKDGAYDSTIIKKFQKKYDKYVKKVSKQNHTTSSSNPPTTNSAKETVNGNTPTGQSPAPKDAEQSFLDDFKKKHPVAFDRLKLGSKITLGTGIGVGSIYAGKKYLDHSNYIDDRDAKTKELRNKIVFGK